MAHASMGIAKIYHKKYISLINLRLICSQTISITIYCTFKHKANKEVKQVTEKYTELSSPFSTTFIGLPALYLVARASGQLEGSFADGAPICQ